MRAVSNSISRSTRRPRAASRSALTRKRARAEAFWGDGQPMLVELLVIAQQLGCALGWDIEPLLSLSRAQLDPTAEMGLSTESEQERALVPERIARLVADTKLRRRYEQLLRTVWAEAEPAVRELGRPTVERAAQSARASIEHGRSPLEIVGDDHIACREP
jgi:hypothetical protein